MAIPLSELLLRAARGIDLKLVNEVEKMIDTDLTSWEVVKHLSNIRFDQEGSFTFTYADISRELNLKEVDELKSRYQIAGFSDLKVISKKVGDDRRTYLRTDITLYLPINAALPKE